MLLVWQHSVAEDKIHPFVSPAALTGHGAAGKIFHDFDQIRQEILQETENMAGGNKGISDKPIRLKICSTNVLYALDHIACPAPGSLDRPLFPLPPKYTSWASNAFLSSI